jgi:hypothetical protein
MTDQSEQDFFTAITTIGELAPEQVAVKLEEIGDITTAKEFRQRAAAVDEGQPLFGWGTPKPWEYASHKLGFLALPAAGSVDPQPIKPASTILADPALKNSQINIHLDRLRIYDYPGNGKHNILFTFMAQNQLATGDEPVSFSRMYEASDGQEVGVAGWPIFIGLNVGATGVAFKTFTVNVANQTDEALLGFLSSSSFQTGLTLLKVAQPVIKPFADMILGVAKSILARNRNEAVQKLDLGLDFTPAALGARLAQGNYVAAQVPDETAINWDNWIYQPNAGSIVSKVDQTATLPFNYIVFRVTRFQE